MKESLFNGSRRSLRALRSLCALCVMMLAVAAFAVPAKPGLTRLLTLTDGSTLNATLIGDEYLHYWLGEDGKAYQAASQQQRGAKGGSEDGDAVYQVFDIEAAKKSADERRSSANQRRARRLAPRKVGNVGNISGEKKGLIILVNFSDVAFQMSNTNALYQRIANEKNFSYTINSNYSFKGSMYDYFYDQSEGQFELTFDVVGPVTVSKTQTYYGENNSNGNDKHAAEMVIEALKLADPQVDYADYDWDGNGTVEQVYVVYADKGEADGGESYTIWPHEYNLYSANYYGDGAGPQTLDGVTINTYACGGELNGSTGLIAGIGTMCHEFSHCLGYPDFYDTDYSGGQGMGYWDLMCSGSYNDDGYQPAGYTSYERWVAGWKTPIELEYTQNISNMAALQATGSDTYIIYNKANRNEYYLLENRQKTGWDTSLPGAGLLILHVDYDADAWTSNQPNDDPDHQRMTWIAADNNYQYDTYNGKKYYSFDGMANDPFPYGSVNAFGKNTTPAATLYNKNSDNTYYLDSSIENITQNSDGTISFNFRGISNVALPNFSPDGGRFTNDQTVTVTITAETGATIYYTTNGDTPTTASTLYTAPFTVTTTTTVKAIAVKNNEESGVATTTYTFVDPYITADESLSFSAEAGSSETKQLTVLTEGLTQDITLTLSDANNVFSLGTTTISKSLEEATVNVTFSPTAAGTYPGTITLTSAGADPVTVSLSATATLPVPTTPADLTLSGETATSFTASWSAVTLAESYELDVATVTESSSTGATLTENFTGFTAVSSYSSTSDYQTVASGTWSYENVIISPNGTANGDGSTGFAQMKAGAGILYLPTVDNPTSITVTARASSGSLILQQKVNGSWTEKESWNLSSTGATYSYTFTNAGAATELRFVAGNKATYIHDISVTYGSSTITYNSISGYPKSVGNVTSCAVTGLTSGTQYAVRVRAVNTYGNSDWSDVASITTDAAPTAPELTASLGTSINAYVGDEDIEFTVTATGYPEPTITATCTEGAYFIFENGEFIFEPDTEGTYHFVFTATNDAGTDQLTVTITVSPAPITVPTLSITDVTTTTASATWTACDGVSSYTLQLASDDQFTTGGSGGSSATQILSENFSGFTGTSTADISNSLNNYTATTGWNGSKVYPENEMAKIGASSDQGWIMTPALNASGTLSVVWSAYRYGTSDKSTIHLGISENGTDFDEETITIRDEMDTFTNTFTVSGPTVYVRWMASGSSKARFYLDDITISTGDSGSGSLIAEYTVTEGTSYTFTGLSPRTTYYARVKGNADWSNVEEFLTEEAPVTGTAPSWSSTFPATASINVGQTYTLADVSSYVSGFPAPTITLSAPAGLQADLEDDTFTFIAESPGNYAFTLTAANGISPDATVTLTVTVSAAQTSPNNEFALITSASEFVEGDYIIVYDGVAMNTTVSSNRLQYVAVTPTNSVITTDDASIIWHIAPSGDYYTIFNAGVNKYAASTGVANKAQLLDSGTDDQSLWSVSAGTTFDFTNKHNAANNVNATLRRNGEYGFACYATGTGGKLSLYKRTSGGIDPTIAYYRNADGKQGSELKTAMCGIIYNRTEQTYNSLWTAFTTTDLRSDGKIWDMYSSSTNYESANKGETYHGEGDCYNREHSFPKSWFGGEVMPMFSDLHHIYPTDGYINGRRSNNPYGETSNPTYTSNGGFSKLGTCTYPGYTGTVFEPNDDYKGDFARTYFYMVTCYEEKLGDWVTNYGATTEVEDVLDGTTYPALTTWQLNMLMKWAKNDPVSEKETNRNNAVYAIQHNRNPFIDYPGLEEYIWGSMTTTAFSYDNYVQPVYKQDVAMSFSPSEATATIGEDFTEPTLTTTPANLTVTYSSSNTNVATVDASTGEVTLKAAGITTITATFAGDDDYSGGTASYTLTVSNPALVMGETLLYEGLTGYTSSGDNNTELTKTDNNLNYKSWVSISKVYAGGTSNAYSNGNGGCLKFGSSNAAGSMTTSSITLTGGGTLTFFLKKYSEDNGTLTVTVDGGYYEEEEFTPTSEWALCTVNFPEDTGDITIKMESTKRAYVDEIKLTSNGTLDLADDDDNASIIAAAADNGGKFNVTLKDRTLYRDGNWNTLCLPFDYDLDTYNSPIDGSGLTVMAFNESTFDNGTLTLNFTTVFDNDTYKGNLVAGTPYLIKWDKDTDNPTITDPMFQGVTIDATTRNKTYELGDGKSVTFCGTYKKKSYNTTDRSVLFLGEESTLYYPESGASIGAQRAYFQLTGIQAGDKALSRLVLHIPDGDNAERAEEYQGITSTNRSDEEHTVWFDLNGRKLDKKPARKGLYIQNGKKVLVP